MEDSMSSTNYKTRVICSASGTGFSCEDISSWPSYIEGSIASSTSTEEDVAVYFGSECSYSIPSDPAAFVDHDLEDTATSPVRSLEVQFLEQFHMKLQETEYGLNRLQAQQLGQNDYNSLFQEEGTASNQTEVVHSGFTELRKQGLCLVPVSMLLNFW